MLVFAVTCSCRSYLGGCVFTPTAHATLNDANVSLTAFLQANTTFEVGLVRIISFYNDHLCILLATCLYTNHSVWSLGMIISGSCERIKLVEGYPSGSSATAEGFMGYHKSPPTTQPSNPGAFCPQPLKSLSVLDIFYGRNSMSCAASCAWIVCLDTAFAAHESFASAGRKCKGTAVLL